MTGGATASPVDIRVFEEHASVLPEWWSRGLSGRTVVYLDAHLDLQYVRPARIEALERCTTLAEMARLEKAHHLLPDDGSSFSIEDFLYPARQLGIVHRLVWVVPPHVPAGFSAAALQQLTQTPGVTLEDICSFHRHAHGHLTGRILGLEITICRLEQLRRLDLDEGTLLDVDTDYLVEVPQDTAWVDPQAVFDTLSRAVPGTELVSLSRSVSSGFLPVRHRYLADHLAALWRRDDLEVSHYGRLHELNRWLDSDKVDMVREGCRQELEAFGACAATLHLASLAESNVERSASLQAEAAELDPAYRPSPLRDACGLTNRHRRVKLTDVMRLEKRVEREPDTRARALGYLAIGQLYCLLGRLDPAEEAYARAYDFLGPNPHLALEIGKVLPLTSREGGTRSYLETATGSDKTAPAAHILLGQHLALTGMPDPALEHLQAAREMTPADPEIPALLARLHRARGDSRAAAAATNDATRQCEALTDLARRLQT